MIPNENKVLQGRAGKTEYWSVIRGKITGRVSKARVELGFNVIHEDRVNRDAGDFFTLDQLSGHSAREL